MQFFSQKFKSIINNNFFRGRSMAVALFLLILIKQIAIYQTYGCQISGGFTDQILLYLGFLGNDLMIMGIVLLLVLINFNINKPKVRRTINIINIILILIFFIDIITIIFFQSRLSMFDIYGLLSASSFKYFLYYCIFALLFFALIFVISFLLSQKLLKKRKDNAKQSIIAISFLIIAIIISSINIASKNNISIYQNILGLNLPVSYEQNIQATPIKKYQEYFTMTKGLNKKPNIILLFAESLSTVDSKRDGGLYDNLPLFDKIQSEGITFTNFIANGCTSEAAHIATLKGVEPREYPRIDTNQDYDAYTSYMESLPLFMQRQGYHTTFVSTVGLDFLNQKEFLSGLHYQDIIGEEAFQDKQKYVFNAAPDHDLYNKTLEIISGYKANQTNYFITLQNISAHIPYDTPYGDSTKEMFSYVDKNLYTFYQKLKNVGFFENGILVIIGDHRKMESINRNEFKKFGLSSKSRIAATIVGKDIKSNAYNGNIIQHTDIYNSLKYLVGDQTKLSSLFNNMFSTKSNRDRGIRYCRFAEKTYVRINKDGSARNVGNQPKDEPIKQYIQAYKQFQAQTLLGIRGLTGYETPHITGQNNTGITLIAHAGGPYDNLIPDTLQTALNAHKDGSKSIEIDISYTKDNQNVVLHGPSLRTTICGIDQSVTGFKLKDLKNKCLLNNNEQIQTLEEFLNKTKDLFDLIFVEIKVYDPDKAKKQTLDAINTIKKLGIADKTIFISYDKTANNIIGSNPKIRAGRDTLQEPKNINQFPHEFFLVPENILSKKIVEMAASMDKKLVVYTLNTKESIQNALNLGVRYIMTDNIPFAQSIVNDFDLIKK